jgi:hypothetical protein
VCEVGSRGVAGVRAKVGRRAGSRTLVGALLQLLVVGRLLDDIKDGDRQRSVREREGLGVGFSLRAERGTRFNERTAAEMCPICRGGVRATAAPAEAD